MLPYKTAQPPYDEHGGCAVDINLPIDRIGLFEYGQSPFGYVIRINFEKTAVCQTEQQSCISTINGIIIDVSTVYQYDATLAVED